MADAETQADTLTEWRYSPRHLLEVIHPTQRERFETDARGLRTARIVTLRTPQGELTSVTRYEHDDTGQLVASTLPDGSRLLYERNGQGQVVALKRQTIQTPWLRWLGTAQTLGSGFERDLVGLRSYTSGNGIEAQYQRSAQGDLARVVYRHTQPRAALQAQYKTNTPLMGRSTQETIERPLGIAPAHAQAVPDRAAPAGTTANSEAAKREAAKVNSAENTPPGALALPHDPQAFIDHRYLWSAGGHLLHSQQCAGNPNEQTQHSHAYDARGQLVASVQASLGETAQNSGDISPVSLNETRTQEQAQEEALEQSVWRYAYDATQRRVLSQQGVASQSDTSSATRRSQFQGTSHRLNLSDQPATYTANGQPERMGSREYVWDALGRLTEVREETRPVARYQYDHRGLRIGKQVMSLPAEPTSVRAEPFDELRTGPVKALTTHTLYEESRQPLAELDAQGRLTRQYIWLADLPLAVFDSPDGQALASEAPGLVQLWLDIRSALSSWLGPDAGIAWLHTNHLGAPEAATNAQGQIIWRASYAPFGTASIQAVRPEPNSVRPEPVEGLTHAFTLHLRLPGQVWDEETGLHYNRQRYYDPELGQYLTPDPLGTPDGPNPYAYVAFNPLGFIDPDGLILFAFDGTRNNRDSRTNVFWLDQAYNGNDSRDIANSDRPYYEEGPGVDSSADGAIAYSLSGRINTQLQRLDNYVSAKWRSEADLGKTFTRSSPLEITLDIVGFSRGAAAARDFANRVVIRNCNGYYRQRPEVRGGCVTVLIRFMGLFDTLASTNISSLNLAIPDAVRHVAHAVAVNEHRATFPGESIERLADVGFSSNRIERGFIGAHSDVGGAYDCRPGSVNCDDAARGDLSDVALNWMWQQAVAAGVPMRPLDAEQMRVTNPVLHDESRVSPWDSLQLGRTDRSFNYGAQSVPQRQAQLQGMTNAQSEAYIARRAQPSGNVVGEVNMTAYRQWLQSNLNLNMQ